jgi:predicted metal-dependent peptidase
VGFATLAVDKYWRLYYDEKALAQWGVEQLAGVLYHEINHLFRDHPRRCESMGAQPRPWNIAADCEINDDLVEELQSASLKLPPEVCLPKNFGWPNGEFAEQYYHRIPQSQQGGGGQGDGEGEGEGDEQGQGKGQAGGGGGGKFDPHGPSRGGCGSCATGRQEPWEQGPPSGSQPGIGQAEGEVIKQQVAVSIQEHTKQRGTVPGFWSRWADARLKPQVNWKKTLAAQIRAAIADVAGATDYSYKKPSRRASVTPGIVMPCLRHPVPEVAVVVDTSGSMSDNLLSQALAEVKGVIEGCGLRTGVSVLAVDAAVHEVGRVFKAEQVKLGGGGGTDMQVGIDAAVALKPKPQIVIVLTDGYTPWAATPPKKTRVIVGLLAEGNAPVWAKSIRIEAPERR